MIPVAYDQLVTGNAYFRRNRVTGYLIGPAVYRGIYIEQGLYYDGGVWSIFDAGLFANVVEDITKYDIFIPGPEFNNLDVSLVPHIGNLVEGTTIVLTGTEDPISYIPFKNGDACVQMIYAEGKFFVYHEDSIQTWFNTGSRTDPQTRIPVSQEMLKRFTYVI